jgi:predicted HTH domain antitoxin
VQITLNIPEELAAEIIAAGQDPAQVTLEALVIDGYRAQRLSEEEVREALGLATRMQVHAVLQQHGVPLHYSIEDFEQDMETSRSLREGVDHPLAG